MLRRTGIVLSLFAMTALFGAALLVAAAPARCSPPRSGPTRPGSRSGAGFLARTSPRRSRWRSSPRSSACTASRTAAAASRSPPPPPPPAQGSPSPPRNPPRHHPAVRRLGRPPLPLEKWSRLDAALAAGACLAVWLLVAPYLIYNRSQAGAAFAPHQAHARFWRNHEFAGRPGFPTRAEVVADSYCGPPITPSGYVFGLHSFPEVVGRLVKGTFAAYTRYLWRLCTDWPWLTLLFPAGLIALIWKRRWEGAWLAFAAIAASTALPPSLAGT